MVFLRDGVRNEMCPAPKPELVTGGSDLVRGGKTPRRGGGSKAGLPGPALPLGSGAESLAPLDLLPVGETGASAVASKAPLRPGQISRLSPPGRGQLLAAVTHSKSGSEVVNFSKKEMKREER